MASEHRNRTTKHYDRDAGECVCEHCTVLPWHEDWPVQFSCEGEAGPGGVPAYEPTDPSPARFDLREP